MKIAMLYRLGSGAFILSGIFNIIADFLPSMLTGLLNFAGVAAGILGLTAVYLYQRHESKVFGFSGYVVTILGFIGIAGFLFVDAFVFPYIDASLKETLTNGPTGIAIFASVIVYVLGVLLFTIASFRANVYPKLPLIFWGVGVAPTLAAIALPAVVMTVAEIVASIGIIWIGVVIWQGAMTK